MRAFFNVDDHYQIIKKLALLTATRFFVCAEPAHA
jgi:hypothetical protein